MKFCVPIPCFFKGDACDAIRRVAKLGFSAVEAYSWKELDASRIREVCLETGVSFLSVCPTEFCMTDPARREAYLAGLSETCAFASSMGAVQLVTQVGQDTGAPREAQRASIVAACRGALPILEKYGIRLLLEPLNVLFDHPGYYLTSSEEAFSIVREVGHPLVKVVFDIYHQQITEGNIIPNIINNLDLIGHLHAAGHPGRHELQFGESDYRNIFAAVDKAGYEGFCGLEYRPLLPAEESLLECKRLYG